MNALYLQRRLTSKIIKTGGITLLVIVITAYAIWRSLNYARGPEIIITSPIDGSGIISSTTIITGKVERAVNVSLNNKDINIDEEGNFKETLIIFKGNNILTFKATDQFERSVEEQLVLYGI